MSEGPLENTEQERTLKGKLWATASSILPERIQRLEQVWGPAILIGFIFGIIPGFAAAMGLFKAGVMPSVLVSDDYKKGDTELRNHKSSKPREKKPTIVLSVLNDPPLWVSTYEKWFQCDADAKRELHLIDAPMIGTAISQRLPASEEFEWVLKVASSNFKIVGRAFRQTTANSINVYEPIDAKQDDSNTFIRFKVPKCEEGDTLLVILMITSPQAIPIDDFLATFQQL
jgi:hypothetical protein